jgi:hypothetical protein
MAGWKTSPEPKSDGVPACSGRRFSFMAAGTGISQELAFAAFIAQIQSGFLQ